MIISVKNATAWTTCYQLTYWLSLVTKKYSLTTKGTWWSW